MHARRTSEKANRQGIAKADRSQEKRGFKTLERIAFGNADGRGKLAELAKECSKAIANLAFFQGTAYMCIDQGDFTLPEMDDIIGKLERKQTAIHTLIEHFDSVRDLDHPARRMFSIALGNGADVAEARRLALAPSATETDSDGALGLIHKHDPKDGGDSDTDTDTSSSDSDDDPDGGNDRKHRESDREE